MDEAEEAANKAEEEANKAEEEAKKEESVTEQETSPAPVAKPLNPNQVRLTITMDLPDGTRTTAGTTVANWLSNASST